MQPALPTGLESAERLLQSMGHVFLNCATKGVGLKLFLGLVTGNWGRPAAA